MRLVINIQRAQRSLSSLRMNCVISKYRPSTLVKHEKIDNRAWMFECDYHIQICLENLSLRMYLVWVSQIPPKAAIGWKTLILTVCPWIGWIVFQRFEVLDLNVFLTLGFPWNWFWLIWIFFCAVSVVHKLQGWFLSSLRGCGCCPVVLRSVPSPVAALTSLILFWTK